SPTEKISPSRNSRGPCRAPPPAPRPPGRPAPPSSPGLRARSRTTGGRGRTARVARRLCASFVMSAPPMKPVVRLVPNVEAHDVIDGLCDAFASYPVMRYVLDGTSGPDDPRMRRLLQFLTMARMLRDEPVLSVVEGRAE